MINWNFLFEHLFSDFVVSKEDAKKIVMTATKFFAAEPNLLYLQDPVTLVGDIHGQFFDMREIIRLGGSPLTTKYLFLGDYVDRGAYGVEVLLCIYALKLNYPNTVFLLRGNHECRQMTMHHYFREECIAKYDQEVYNLIMESFDKMPIAAVINSQFMAVHGGISPGIENCLDINGIDRFIEPPQFGTLCDLLWSDPVDNETGAQDAVWKPNISRNCSYYFGYQAISNFLRKNELMTLIRAHEAQFEGFKAYAWQNRDFPQVITLFSAPNYCGTYANKGAIMKLMNNDLQIYQYDFTQKPDKLLSLGDAFTWSLPILSRSLMDMFIGFVGFTNDAVMDNAVQADISMLDDSVLNALDIHAVNKKELQQNEFSALELLVEEQKKKRNISNASIIRRLSKPASGIKLFEENNDNDILNESFPDHFRLMKTEDILNESRPKI